MTFSDGPAPLYFQLFHEFRNNITKGEWTVDTQVPTVEDLFKKYNVSRSTIRKALELMERDGLISKKRGKGTFVKMGEMGSTYLALKELEQYQDSSHFRVLSAEFIKPPVHVKRFFSPQRADKVLCIKRQNLKDGIVSEISDVFVRQDIGKKIDHEDLGRYYLSHIVQNILGIKMSRILRVIRPWMCNQETSEQLGISPCTPIFRFEFTGYDLSENVLFYSEVYSRNGGLFLEVDLKKDSSITVL